MLTGTVHATKRDPELRAEVEWEKEQAEVAAAKAKAKADADKKKADAELADRIAYEQAEEKGELITCGCCFCEYPFEKFQQCSEGCLFCGDCLKRYAETQLFGQGRTALKCMARRRDSAEDVSLDIGRLIFSHSYTGWIF